MLKKGKISIWTIDKDAAPSAANYLQYLSDGEKKRASKYRFDKDRDIFLLGRGILRVLLGRHMHKDPSGIEFKYGQQGKPYLDNKEAPHFNISHSGKLLVMAFCLDHPLGIDVEEIKSNFDLFELAKHHFSDLEIKALKSLDENERTRGFYRCWTRKESFIKAVGSGLSFPLDSFSVSILEDLKAELIETKWATDEKEKWALTSFVPADGYLAALSIRNLGSTIEHNNWP